MCVLIPAKVAAFDHHLGVSVIKGVDDNMMMPHLKILFNLHALGEDNNLVLKQNQASNLPLAKISSF